jgi:hypothetical protein
VVPAAALLGLLILGKTVALSICFRPPLLGPAALLDTAALLDPAALLKPLELLELTDWMGKWFSAFLGYL